MIKSIKNLFERFNWVLRVLYFTVRVVEQIMKFFS
jgi:hypothetical protein